MSSSNPATAQSTAERSWNILSRLEDVTETGENQWKCICPAHDDNKQSLSVGVGRDGRTLVMNCFAKCETKDILAAMGLNILSLFPDPQGKIPGPSGRGSGSSRNQKSGAHHSSDSANPANPANASSQSKKGKGKYQKSIEELGDIIATYDYTDETGNLVFQVCRFENKEFRQRRPKENGKKGWIWSVKNAIKVPYHLQQIVTSGVTSDASSVEKTATIFIVEGEKDADNLAALNLISTTNAGGGGSGQWLTTDPFIKPFTGRHVVILPDNDVTGRQSAEDISRKLHTHAASIKILTLPNLKEKGDVTDWIQAGGTAERLLELSAAAPDYVYAPVKPFEANDDPYRLARVILSQYQRVIFWRDEWYVMRDSSEPKSRDIVYRQVSLTEWRAIVSRLIKSEFDRINIEAISEDPSKTNVCLKVVQALVTNVIGAMQSLCSLANDAELGCWLPVHDSHQIGPNSQLGQAEQSPKDFEISLERKNWVSLKNGILKIDDLLDGKPESEYLIPHTPRFFTTVSLPFAFNWEAESPLWSRYLESSLEGDTERIELLQEWAGYLLTPTTDQQKFLILEGEGSNGKSVYLAAIEAMLGPQNVSHVPLEIFGQRFQLTSTLGKLANSCADCGEIDQVAEGFLKSFTSGDRMQFDRKNIAAIDATPTARLMIATNTRPRFSDKSSGLWRRMLLVPFLRQIPHEERIPGMDKPAWWMLRPDELSGIMNWALVGLSRLREQDRFTIPEICKQAIEDYKDETNPVRSFLTDLVTEGDLETEWILSSDMYDKYRNWTDKNGYRPLASRSFGKELKRTFPEMVRRQIRSNSERLWAYFGLKYHADAPTSQYDDFF